MSCLALLPSTIVHRLPTTCVHPPVAYTSIPCSKDTYVIQQVMMFTNILLWIFSVYLMVVLTPLLICIFFLPCS